MAVDYLDNRPLHLSFDIDSCDPGQLMLRSLTHSLTHTAIAPSTGTTVRGGLTFREAHFVAEAISDTGMVVV